MTKTVDIGWSGQALPPRWPWFILFFQLTAEEQLRNSDKSASPDQQGILRVFIGQQRYSGGRSLGKTELAGGCVECFSSK